MNSKLIFCLVLLGQYLYGMSNEDLFAQSTGGGGPGGGGNPPPVACTCAFMVSRSCSSISGWGPNDIKTWPGGPTATPQVNCAIGIPQLGIYYTCLTSADCPMFPFADHQVSENDWNTLRSFPLSSGGNPQVWNNGQWGWWGNKVLPTDPFECKWRTDCAKCKYNDGEFVGRCKSRTYSIRDMAQVLQCPSNPSTPCWIPAGY
jgi:hypothetical protein